MEYPRHSAGLDRRLACRGPGDGREWSTLRCEQGLTFDWAGSDRKTMLCRHRWVLLETRPNNRSSGKVQFDISSKHSRHASRYVCPRAPLVPNVPERVTPRSKLESIKHLKPSHIFAHLSCSPSPSSQPWLAPELTHPFFFCLVFHFTQLPASLFPFQVKMHTSFAKLVISGLVASSTVASFELPSTSLARVVRTHRA